MPEPRGSETEQEFMSRCIPELIGEGKDQAQASAICYSLYEGKQKTYAPMEEAIRGDKACGDKKPKK